MARGKRRQRIPVGTKANELQSWTLYDERAETLMEALASLSTLETDPDWDWPTVGLFLDSHDGGHLAEVRSPIEAFGEDWRARVIHEEFPRLIGEFEPTRIGLVLNGAGEEGREHLILFLADSAYIGTWISEIGRRPDGVRMLRGWQRNPKLEGGQWWAFIESCHEALAELDAPPESAVVEEEDDEELLAWLAESFVAAAAPPALEMAALDDDDDDGELAPPSLSEAWRGGATMSSDRWFRS